MFSSWEPFAEVGRLKGGKNLGVLVKGRWKASMSSLPLIKGRCLLAMGLWGVLSLLLVACPSGPSTSQGTRSTPTGIVLGTVVVDPVGPFAPVGTPNPWAPIGPPVPVPGVQMAAKTETGTVMARATTEAQGRFRMQLVAGPYFSALVGEPAVAVGSYLTQSQAAEVLVVAGQTTTVQIQLGVHRALSPQLF